MREFEHALLGHSLNERIRVVQERYLAKLSAEKFSGLALHDRAHVCAPNPITTTELTKRTRLCKYGFVEHTGHRQSHLWSEIVVSGSELHAILVPCPSVVSSVCRGRLDKLSGNARCPLRACVLSFIFQGRWSREWHDVAEQGDHTNSLENSCMSLCTDVRDAMCRTVVFVPPERLWS